MEIIVIVLIVVFPICGLILYYIKTKNEERIKLIEKGINPDEGLDITEYRKQTYVKNGVFFISIGVGLLIPHIPGPGGNYFTINSFINTVISLLIFGGIGFLINYRIMKRWNRK
jgi:hypothetical protein